MTPTHPFRRLTVLVVTAIALGAGGVAQSREVASYDAFEDGAVPSHWVLSRQGALSISALHYKHGGQSLRWDFWAGDTIRVEADLGNVNRHGGYGGTYSKATFGVWVYSQEPQAGSLRWEFRTGDDTDAWFDFPLSFTGWQRAHLKYTTAPHSHHRGTQWDVDFEGQVRPTMNNILIRAPEQGPSGTVFIDLVVYNGLLDYRQQHVPTAEDHQPFSPDPARFPVPEAVTPEEDAAVEYLEGRMTPAPGTGLSDEAMSAVEQKVAAVGIVKDEHGIRGLPVVHAGWMEFYQGIEGVISAREIANLMLDVARAYHRAHGNAAQRERVGDWYALLAEHIRDQGMKPGMGFNWGGYDGRNLAEANFLMRQPLRERGLLHWAAAYLDAGYGVRGIFGPDRNRHMDYFHLSVQRMLQGALMQVERPEQVRYLHALGRRLGTDILHPGPEGYKPDGSAYHHRFHYFAYAGYSTRSLVNVLEPLSHTPFAVSGEALERVKQVALAMRMYCNRLHLPLCLSGRHPFSGQRLDPNMLFTLARCGSPDGAHDLDPDLAAAFLRLTPDAADHPLIVAHGITPEPEPEGNLTMGYAGLTAHRRDNWLALAKGYNRYVLYGEIYANNNRFGRYISNGALEIIGGGDPVTLADSGYVADGWDWNRFEGTTVIYLPPGRLRAVSSGTEWIPSSRTFVGGLSHRGWNGAFVMQIEGHERHEPTFTGKKTYFFFDDRIICLGSDITNEDAVHPTHTNLFQKHLPDPSEGPTWVNGAPLAGLEVDLTLPADRASWLLDPQRTGYYLPAGQTVRVARANQVSRDHADREDNAGDFATGWIDHGTAPQAAGYEYALIVRASPERMEQFTAEMEAPDRRPYEVLRHDARAHIVFDRESGTWGAVLFEAGRMPPGLAVLEVDRPCLLMIEPGPEGALYLGVSDPDLRLEDHVSVPLPLRITLRGTWNIANPSADFRVVERTGGTTALEVTCHDGFSFDLELTPG